MIHLPGLCSAWAERQPGEGRGAESLLEGLLLAGDAHAGGVHDVLDRVRWDCTARCDVGVEMLLDSEGFLSMST